MLVMDCTAWAVWEFSYSFSINMLNTVFGFSFTVVEALKEKKSRIQECTVIKGRVIFIQIIILWLKYSFKMCNIALTSQVGSKTERPAPSGISAQTQRWDILHRQKTEREKSRPPPLMLSCRCFHTYVLLRIWKRSPFLKLRSSSVLAS